MILIAAAAFLSLSGAFGTERATLLVRALFWGGLLAIGTGANHVAQAALAGRDLPGPPMLKAVLVSLAVSLPLTPVVVGMVWLAFGEQPAGWRLWAYVLTASLAVSSAVAALHVLAASREPLSTHASGPSRPEAPFLKRLPPRLRGAALFAVEAEDHYLRVHTSQGSDLILMRLGDAVAELEGLEGARVHRSWWVARESVQDVRREGGRTTLILTGGGEAPVSRSYVAALREEGWFS